MDLYRGENINSLTKPIPPNPIVYMDQVLHNKIPLYDLFYLLPKLYRKYDPKSFKLENATMPFKHLVRTTPMDAVSLTLFMFCNAHDVTLEIPVQPYIPKLLSTFENRLLNHSMLHPSYFRIGMIAANIFASAQQKVAETLEIFVDDCKDPNKPIAVFLPNAIADVAYSGLRHWGAVNVHISKDIVAQLVQGYYFFNTVESKILRKFKALFISGIVPWWLKSKEEHLIRFGYVVTRKVRKLTSHEGKDLTVIFSLLFIGIICSVLVFLYEFMPWFVKKCRILRKRRHSHRNRGGSSDNKNIFVIKKNLARNLHSKELKSN